MDKFLRNLYKRFLIFKKKYFSKDVFNFFGIGNLKIDKFTLSEIFENYYKIPFFEFLCDLKLILFSQNFSDFLLKKGTDDWELWYYLEFLRKEKIIKIAESGKISLFERKILNFLPKPKKEEEIREIIEKKLKRKIKDKEAILTLFSKEKIEKDLDQLPISQESAIFLVEKILERLPLFETFLFVGDDDLISLILGLVEPKVKSFVVDLDDNLLNFIFNFSKKFDLKIQTKKWDITKKLKIQEDFIGFLANPIYTEEGIKKFLNFGISQLGRDGGVVFLELGDEAIGNRFLFLEEFFVKKQLWLREAITKKIYYPKLILHKEDRIIRKRLKNFFSQEMEFKIPRLGATLFIFDYIPFKIKKVKFKTKISGYI